MATRFETVEGYVASFPAAVQERLEALRDTVRSVVPEAVESISYGMPTYRVDGRALVHVAAWAGFISVYPAPEGDAAFRKELAPYRATRATVRFPLDQPLPLDLFRRLVELLLAQRREDAAGQA